MDQSIDDIAAFMKALSDPTRLRIIQLLAEHESLCVCDLTTRLDLPQPTISRHLNQLKARHLVTSTRRGTWMWYALDRSLPNWCQQVIAALPREQTLPA